RADPEPTLHDRVGVRDGVGEGEGQPLNRIGSGLADVVAADRDGVPARELRRTVRDEIRGKTHRGPRRKDVRPAGDVLLEDVVLRGPTDPFGSDALLLTHRDVHREQDRRGRVDGHRRGDLGERDAFEDAREIVDRAQSARSRLFLGIAAMVAVEGALPPRTPGLSRAEDERPFEAAETVGREPHWLVVAGGPELRLIAPELGPGLPGFALGRYRK